MSFFAKLFEYPVKAVLIVVGLPWLISPIRTYKEGDEFDGVAGERYTSSEISDNNDNAKYTYTSNFVAFGILFSLIAWGLTGFANRFFPYGVFMCFGVAFVWVSAGALVIFSNATWTEDLDWMKKGFIKNKIQSKDDQYQRTQNIIMEARAQRDQD